MLLADVQVGCLFHNRSVDWGSMSDANSGLKAFSVVRNAWFIVEELSSKAHLSDYSDNWLHLSDAELPPARAMHHPND